MSPNGDCGASASDFEGSEFVCCCRKQQQQQLVSAHSTLTGGNESNVKELKLAGDFPQTAASTIREMHWSDRKSTSRQHARTIYCNATRLYT